MHNFIDGPFLHNVCSVYYTVCARVFVCVHVCLFVYSVGVCARVFVCLYMWSRNETLECKEFFLADQSIDGVSES